MGCTSFFVSILGLKAIASISAMVIRTAGAMLPAGHSDRPWLLPSAWLKFWCPPDNDAEGSKRSHQYSRGKGVCCKVCYLAHNHHQHAGPP